MGDQKSKEMSLFRQRLPKKSVKAYTTVLKGSLGNTQLISIKAQNPYCAPSQVFAVQWRHSTVQILSFYLSALSHALLSFFVFFGETAEYSKCQCCRVKMGESGGGGGGNNPQPSSPRRRKNSWSTWGK